ncbi:MAG: hypothetical protein LKG27_03965 [Clostridiaceae bacterium]|jgi:hypothetical protein|nr:hypothetical protein [Clostridiaceae bacterium]
MKFHFIDKLNASISKYFGFMDKSNPKAELFEQKLLTIFLLLCSLFMIWYFASDSFVEKIIFNKKNDTITIQKILPIPSSKTIAKLSNIESSTIISEYRSIPTLKGPLTASNIQLITKNNFKINTFDFADSNKDKIVKINNSTNMFLKDKKSTQLEIVKYSLYNITLFLIAILCLFLAIANIKYC